MSYERKIVISGKLIQVYNYIKPIQTGFVSNRENYEQSDESTTSKKSLNRTRNIMIRTIQSNVTKYTKFITLTTKENVTCRETFLKYFNNFRRNFKNNFNEPLKYMGVLENQKRGAYHIHLVVFNTKKLEFTKLKEIWKYGSVDIKLVDSVDNIGRYLAKYLTKENIEIKKKAVFKSRNLKEPLELTFTGKENLKQTAELYKDIIPHFEENWFITAGAYDDNGNLDINKVNHCEFKEYLKK